MDGYPVTVKTPLLEAHSDSDDAALRRALQEKVAASIARLFYKAPTEE
jgi:hypothetical protein